MTFASSRVKRSLMIYDVRRFTSWDVDLPAKSSMTNGSLYRKSSWNLAPAQAWKRPFSRNANNVLFNKPTNIEFSIKRQQKAHRERHHNMKGRGSFSICCVYGNCDIVMNFSRLFVWIICRHQRQKSKASRKKIYFCTFHIMKNKCYSMQMMSLTCQSVITKAFFFRFLVLRTPKVN